MTGLSEGFGLQSPVVATIFVFTQTRVVPDSIHRNQIEIQTMFLRKWVMPLPGAWEALCHTAGLQNVRVTQVSALEGHPAVQILYGL